MPIFEYECTECGKRYEIFHKVHEVEEDIFCPSCQSLKHKRLISASGISITGRNYSKPTSLKCEYSEDGLCNRECGSLNS